MERMTSPPCLSLAPLLACCALALSLAAPAAASELGEPYLVRDVEVTGEPFFADCHVTCPPPIPVYGAIIGQLTPLGDRVVFVANDRIHGFEPWVSDGTAEGTVLLADTCVGSDCGSVEPLFLDVVDGRLYFFAYSLETGGQDLWVSDGTPEGTRRLDELCPDLCDTIAQGPSFVFEGSLFFHAYEPGHARYYLWRTDGTVEGTARVQPACRAGSVCFSRVADFFTYGGRLFYSDAADLWRLDDPDSTPVVAWSGTPTSVARLGPKMILGLGSTLWSMAAPLAAPQQFVDVGTGSDVSQLTRLGDHVYFVRTEGGVDHLWQTDGTAAGTTPVASYRGLVVQIVGTLNGGLVVRILPEPSPLPVVPITLWWIAPDGPAEGLSYLQVESVTVVGERIFFSAAQDQAHGRELWVSDGTAAGTMLHADIAPGPLSSDPGGFAGFTAAGGRLFFDAFHQDVDTELWALDLDTEEEPPPPPPPPPPPSDEWLESAALPGFRVQVRITGGAEPILGRMEAACIPETLCVSGALPGRSEVFVRVVGPKPNGFLWPTLVKFSTSRVEVWIEQLATGELRYYLLEEAERGVDELPGLFDRTGFQPE